MRLTSRSWRDPKIAVRILSIMDLLHFLGMIWLQQGLKCAAFGEIPAGLDAGSHVWSNGPLSTGDAEVRT
jgi:hypothetical protein